MERIIYEENPINSRDRQVAKEGSKIIWEKFAYIDFVKGTRKDRRIAYLISSFGRVIDTSTGEEVKIKRLNKGRGIVYEKISLYLEMGGYRIYDINDLVAEAFVEDPNKDKYKRDMIYSLDGNRNNHRFDNLKWINYTERYVINMIKNNEPDISRLIKVLIKHDYDDKDIKEFFKSKPISKKIKITDIRKIRKEMNSRCNHIL